MPLVEDPNETIICDPDSCADAEINLFVTRGIGSDHLKLTGFTTRGSRFTRSRRESRSDRAVARLE